MLIETVTGGESFSAPSAASMDVMLWLDKPGLGAMQRIDLAHRDARSGCRLIGTVERLPASNASDKNGQWEIGRYDVPAETLFMLHIKSRGAGTFLYEHFRVYLRTREGAALRELRIPFTGNPMANMACGYVQGNFDIIPPAWFADLKLNPLYPDHYDQDNMADWLTVRELEPETTAYRPLSTVAVTTTTGKQVVLPRMVGTRKLTMPKRVK